MNLSKTQIAILGLITANIIWGASYPIYKWTLEAVPPFTFAFLRFFIGALILLPFAYNNLKIAREDYKNLFLLALISVTFLIPILFFGLKLSPSINAPIIASSGPIILIIAAIIFLKEKPKPKIIAGTLISLMGIMAIILRPLLDSGTVGSILGNVLILIATILSVVQIILLKKLSVRNRPISIVFWMFFIGSIPLIPFVIWESNSFNLIYDLSMQGLIGIVYAIFLSTIIAHFLFVYGTKYIDASEMGIFGYVDPVATILVAVPLLGETITATYLLGSVLVFLGIYVAEGRIHYHPLHRLRNP